jgi:hypothetical protein
MRLSKALLAGLFVAVGLLVVMLLYRIDSLPIQLGIVFMYLMSSIVYVRFYGRAKS